MKAALILASALTVAAMSVPAFAQDTLKVQKPITVFLGGVKGTESGSETLPSLGVSYDFGKTTATNPIVYGAFIDYATKKISGTTVSLTGIGVQGRYLLASPSATSGTPYANLGLGYYTAKVSGGGSDSKFGAKVGLGYELKNGIIGSLDYLIIDNGNAWQYRLGYRF
jgi:hypothetical protein